MNTCAIEQRVQPGDLLFQLCVGGEREWLISRLFEAVGKQAINHVALYAGGGQVIEAVAPAIIKTPIDVFIGRSVKDLHNKPCVMVSRLKTPYEPLIPAAIKFAEKQLAQPYDDSYGSQSGWYCSQLILEAFRYANHDKYLFERTAMSFRDPETGEIFPYWIEYYKAQGVPVPQGEMGSHPALISLSDKLNLIKTLGSLPFKNTHTNLNTQQILV